MFWLFKKKKISGMIRTILMFRVLVKYNFLYVLGSWCFVVLVKDNF